MRSLLRIRSSLVPLLCAAGASALLAACPAVYPEVKTAMHKAPPGQPLEPPPPPELRWLAFKEATIPALTRDGRRWGSDLGGGLPDPYANLILNGAELFRTSVEKATLHPTWRGSTRGNFRLSGDDRLRVEIWDSRVMNDHLIGLKETGPIAAYDQRFLEEIQEECASGVTFKLANEPAHGTIGYGLDYELRTYDVFITRVFEESPAARIGMRAGDQLIAINGKMLTQMREGEMQSLFNAPVSHGIDVTLRHQDGSQISAKLKEGAIYPLFAEIGVFE